METGRLCVKLAGRDAGNVCVVVDQLDKNFVLIDGNVRRRKCNILHLEPLPDVIKIKKNASHGEVSDEFKRLKLAVWHTKPKSKTTKPLPQRKSAQPVPEKAKEEKKAEKQPKSKPAKQKKQVTK